MRSMSMSLTKGKGNIKHNERTQEHVPLNVDESRTKYNAVLVSEPLEEAYEYLFDEAVALYNSKQKRSDRKIDDYYRHTVGNKKTKAMHELVVQIGNLNDTLDRETASELFEAYVREFRRNNRQMRVVGAYIHFDESTPHLHLDYVPFAEYSRGLTRRVNNNKAIEQMGYGSWIEWRNEQFELLEHVARGFGIERDVIGDTSQKMTVKEYKEMQRRLDNEMVQTRSDTPLVGVEPKHFPFSKTEYVEKEAFDRIVEENRILRKQHEVDVGYAEKLENSIVELRSKEYVHQHEQDTEALDMANFNLEIAERHYQHALSRNMALELKMSDMERSQRRTVQELNEKLKKSEEEVSRLKYAMKQNERKLTFYERFLDRLGIKNYAYDVGAHTTWWEPGQVHGICGEIIKKCKKLMEDNPIRGYERSYDDDLSL